MDRNEEDQDVPPPSTRSTWPSQGVSEILRQQPHRAYAGNFVGTRSPQRLRQARFGMWVQQHHHELLMGWTLPYLVLAPASSVPA